MYVFEMDFLKYFHSNHISTMWFFFSNLVFDMLILLENTTHHTENINCRIHTIVINIPLEILKPCQNKKGTVKKIGRSLEHVKTNLRFFGLSLNFYSNF